MFYRMRNTCFRSIRRWRQSGTALALAGIVSHCVLAQSSSDAVKTLGGTGDPGYIDGVKGTSQFHTPSALALRGDGDLFIADSDNNAVRVLRVSDNRMSTFAQANHPIGLAFDSKTNLFVASQSDGTILQFDYYKNLRRTLSPTLSSGPMTALAIDRTDNLYAA